MNKKLAAILWLLLAAACIVVICTTPMTIVMAFLCKEYGKAVALLALDIVCAERAGTAIAKLIKLWKNRAK